MIDITTLTPKDKNFLQSLKAQGKSPQEALSILESVKPKPVSLPPEEAVKIASQKPIQTPLQKGVEGIKEGFSNIGGRLKEAATTTGEMFKENVMKGAEGVMEVGGAIKGAVTGEMKPMEAIKEGGEGLLKAVSGTAGGAGSLMAGPVVGALKPELTQAVQSFMQSRTPDQIEAIRQLEKFATSLPSDVKQSAGALFDVLSLGGISAAEKGIAKAVPEVIKAGEKALPMVTEGVTTAGKGLKQVGTELMKPIKETAEELMTPPVKVPEQVLDTTIDKVLSKAIRPSVRGMKNASAIPQYNEKAREAIKTIAKNKENIKFTDAVTGEVVTGRLPETLLEASDALTQTKKLIYNQYNSLSKAAGETGANLSMAKPINKLKSLVDDVTTRPEIRKYAQQRIDWLKEVSVGSPEQVETLIKNLNEGAPNMFSSGPSKIKAQVDVSIANLLREDLDNVISEALDKKGYQELKNQYGSLKTIEKDLLNRALVDARKTNKGLLDMTDIFSGGDLALAAISMNPAFLGKAVAQKGIASLFKYINDPNRMVKSLFEKVDQFVNTPK